jgi:hypothetical protein
MPVVKGLPERPKKELFYQSLPTYVLALEKYCDDLENWIDLRAFQDGDDEEPTDISKIANIKEQNEQLVKQLLTLFGKTNEKVLKEWIVHKWPKGIGLYE